jgi:putative oxidoreductase
MESQIVVRGPSLQRLFSTFANGLPGKGLFVLRLILAAYLIQNNLSGDGDSARLSHLIARALAGTAGLFILVGLWTPVASVLSALVQLWAAVSDSGDPWAHVLAVALGVGLALLGPGAYSIDARAYGRRRISIGHR